MRPLSSRCAKFRPNSFARYRVAKDPGQLQAHIVQAIVSGVSSRGVKEIKPNSPGVNKSNVSRLWEEAGSKFIEQLRGKDLGSITWCGLMLDGIRLSKDQTAVVALGIRANAYYSPVSYRPSEDWLLLIDRDARRPLRC